MLHKLQWDCALHYRQPGVIADILPPIAAGAFPAPGEGIQFRFTQRSISASLFFCLSNRAVDFVGRNRVGDWSIANFNIEDDVLVTDDGCHVLSQAIPKEPDELEAIVSESR